MSRWEPSIGASDEWYTPRYIFDAIGETFDLDVANSAVGAAHVPCRFSIGSDSLSREWFGFIWMNERDSAHIRIDYLRDVLDEALARLGAAQRETLERVVDAYETWQHSYKPRPLADVIRALPLDPEAAAALERALQAEREAIAAWVRAEYERDWDMPWREQVSAAILARGQKEGEQ